jgi:hypothetical protein
MVDTDLSSLFYFEFTVTDAGITGCVSLVVCRASLALG